MSPADEVRRLLDEILRLRNEVESLEAHLLHDQADLAKAQVLSAEAEERSAVAEERSDRSEHRVRELERILANRTQVGAASGIIQQREGVDDVEAFAILRAGARKARMSLDDFSAEIVNAHNNAVRPAPATPPRSKREAILAGLPTGEPPTILAHGDCLICGGTNVRGRGACREFHQLVDILDDVALGGLVFQ